MTAIDKAEPPNDLRLTTGALPVLPTYRLLFLISDDSPGWFRDLCVATASRAHFLVYTATGGDHFSSAIDQHRPDAVLGTRHDPCLQQFSRLFKRDDISRALCVLVSDHDDPDNSSDNSSGDADDEADTVADFVLPPQASSLGQLKASLRLRAQAIQLHHSNRALETQLVQQQKWVQEHERLNDEVNLLKNAIVRNVSHELRTPILHLKAAVGMLAEDNANNKLTAYATEATARVEAIVKNIGQLAASLEIQIAPVLVREVVDQAVRALLRSWQHKDDEGRVRIHIEPGLPPALGDKQGLMTVVQLLLDNALKFSERPVDIAAYTALDGVRIAVCDYGIGIAQSELQKIFDSFYQVDGTSTRRYGGAGVGLAIVRLILDKHGIPIEVESRQGQGSSFIFTLPTAELQDNSPSPTAE